MDKPRIRAATAADLPGITDIVDEAYRHYITRLGKPPAPMLDDYAARVSEGAVWVLEEGTVLYGSPKISGEECARRSHAP